MRNYFRIRLGQGGRDAADCLTGEFVGVDYGLDEDLTGKVPDEWRAFNAQFIPVLMTKNSKKTKIGAGLSCGAIWTVSKGMNTGDLVICPDAAGSFQIGEVTGGYIYQEGGPLPHRRPVRWLRQGVERSALSPELWASMKTPQTVIWLEKHGTEIEGLLGEAQVASGVIATNPEIEDPIAFAMEKHLEEFLIANWAQTDLAKEWRIFEEDGEVVGQQYPTDSGPADILAVSHDGARLLVIELKRGRASDVVVGQILRYMGFVQSELAEPRQTVEGVIIALDDDKRLQRAISMVPSIRFMRYRVSFSLSGD
jgi:endonuclease NucS-like protein